MHYREPGLLGRRRVLQGGVAAALTALSGLRPIPARSMAQLSYWNHFTSQTEQRGLQRVDELFRAKYPEIGIRSETIPNAEYITKITTAVLANSLPDTAMITGDRFPDMKTMGAFHSLTPELGNWPKTGDFTSSAWSSIESNGEYFGIPAFSFVNWMYYRKDYFEEAGITEVPDTLDDFVQACIKTTDPAKNRYGFGLRGGGGGHHFLLDMMHAFGSPIVVDQKPAIDRRRAIEAVRFYSDLYTRHQVAPPSAPNDSYRQIMEAFKTGQTAMIWHHTGSLTELTPFFKPEQLGTAIRPKGPSLRAARIDHVFNAITSTEHREDAWNWISFWADENAAVAFLDETGYFPASLKAAKDQRITGNPLYEPAIQTLAFGQPAIRTPGVESWAVNSMWPEFQRVLIGEISVEIAVDNFMFSLDRALR